jgi:glycosyltransferase involved in cell wall biosynthesis
MAPNKKSHAKKNHPANNHLPFVSVCTPTFNRRPFIPTMLECFRNQTYPKNRMEWIIVDDGTDKIEDLILAANIPQIKYFDLSKKMALGAKRNFMHDKSRGSIIVYMDDDDYYPPERVEYAVEKLTEHPEALCAGASEIYIFFKHIQQMYQFGPYGPNHATAGTFAFRRELLKQSRYEDTAALAEEKVFLKNYTIPFVQLDPLKCILVFSHEQNTFDKRILLDNPHPDYVRPSPKTVDMFIRGGEKEAKIKKYFLEDIGEVLKNYEPGTAKYKPDVLVQMKQIEAERQKIMQQNMQQMQNAPQQIMMQVPGGEPRALNMQEIVGIIQQQQQHLQAITQRNQELEIMVLQLQQQLSSSSSTPTPLLSSPELFGQQPTITPWTYQPPLPPSSTNANLPPNSDVTLNVPLQINQDALKKFQVDMSLCV